MAMIKHLCGIRVKLVHTNDGKQCEGCVFDKGVGNRCKPYWQCLDILMLPDTAIVTSKNHYTITKGHCKEQKPNGAYHWERA